MNKEIEKILNETIKKNELVKINDKLYLTRYQKEILDFYKIDYKSCKDINGVLFLIDEAISDREDEDFTLLDEIASSLQEFNYYHYVHK